MELLNPTGIIDDAVVIEFKFRALTDHITFNYIFASEEYEGGNSYACTFADTFAFIISGPGIDNVNPYQLSAQDPTITNVDLGGKDIALIPGTNIPVSVTNVFEYFDGTTCDGYSGWNQEYYQSNWEGNFQGAVEYNGMTIPLTAEADIIPNEWYTVKLKIGDALDNILDSAVFLEAGSFDLSNTIELPDDLITANQTAVCGDSITLEVENFDNATYNWYFNGTPIDGEHSNSYTAQTVETGGLGNGTYMLEADFGYGCLLMDDIQIEFISPPEIPDEIPDYLLCDADGDGYEEFDLSMYDNILSSNSDVDVAYFASMEDAENNENALSSPYTNTSTPTQTIYARLSNQPDCYSIAEFQLNTQAVTVNDIQADGCSTEPGSSEMEVNLAQYIDDIAGDQEDVSVTFYATQADAEAGTNSIGDTYTGETTTLYSRVENEFGCFDMGEVNLTINALPEIFPVDDDDLLACNEGYSTGNYNLDKIAVTALGGQSDVTISFYETEADAVAGENEIMQGEVVPLTAPRTLFIRAMNNQTGCATYATENLIIENCKPDVPNAFTPNGDGTNDVFTIHRLKTVFEDYRMYIYNRWGTLVYEGGPDDPFWDGTVDGVITDDPSGTVYFYVLELNDGEHKPLKGTIYVKP